MDFKSVQAKVNMGCHFWLKDEMTAKKSLQEEEGEGVVNMDPYTCMDDFRSDIKQIFENARTYNAKETIFYKYAQQLEALIKPMLNRLRDTQLTKPGEEPIAAANNTVV